MLRKSFGILGGAALAGGAVCGRFRRDDAVKSNCGAKVTAGFVEALEARLAKLEAQQMSKGPLDGKVALVTGGSRGLGLGMALGMAEAGAHVVLNGRGEAALVAARERIEGHGGSASIAVFDVTDEAAMIAGVAAVLAEQGRIDILMNNAGINLRSKFVESTAEQLRRVLDVNLVAPYLLAREVAKHMIARGGGGRIINIGSVQSVVGRATIQPYACSKHAIHGMTKGLATELGPHGITVNAIGPGYFITEMTKSLLDNENFNKMVTGRTPLGRWGYPADLAGPAVFLASDGAGFVNGHLLMVDGGMTISLCDSLLPPAKL